ncbi:hypothetical protein ACOI1H_20740 [Loktanella sp. DJP18]|uniref:hypothetical protein n=1 Tax=Loktanella sp. DJP18 TaxID=3409788 RepID=UPI003BB50476
MDKLTRDRVDFLRQLHSQVCFADGDHPDESDTAYSCGADAIERLAAIDAKAKAKTPDAPAR